MFGRWTIADLQGVHLPAEYLVWQPHMRSVSSPSLSHTITTIITDSPMLFSYRPNVLNLKNGWHQGRNCRFIHARAANCISGHLRQLSVLLLDINSVKCSTQESANSLIQVWHNVNHNSLMNLSLCLLMVNQIPEPKKIRTWRLSCGVSSVSQPQRFMLWSLLRSAGGFHQSHEPFISLRFAAPQRWRGLYISFPKSKPTHDMSPHPTPLDHGEPHWKLPRDDEVLPLSAGKRRYLGVSVSKILFFGAGAVGRYVEINKVCWRR